MTVRLELDGRAYYLKRNTMHPVEVWKRLSRFRLPPRNAAPEWENIRAVTAAGIPTVRPIAMGESLFLGIEVSSFLITEELYGARSLEEIALHRFQNDASTSSERRALIFRVAQIARALHTNGMNHQDFYLSHLYLGRDGSIYLIDLQRVGRRRTVPRRYIVKDLAQLNYSASHAGSVSRSERLRFFMEYLGVATLRSEEKRLARQINAKTERIAKHTVKLLRRRRQRGEIP